MGRTGLTVNQPPPIELLARLAFMPKTKRQTLCLTHVRSAWRTQLFPMVASPPHYCLSRCAAQPNLGCTQGLAQGAAAAVLGKHCAPSASVPDCLCRQPQPRYHHQRTNSNTPVRHGKTTRCVLPRWQGVLSRTGHFKGTPAAGYPDTSVIAAEPMGRGWQQ